MKPRFYLSAVASFLVLGGCLSDTKPTAPEKISVNPAASRIQAPASQKLAADELALHLKLITGVDVPVGGKTREGEFEFKIGSLPPGAKPPSAWAEAVYQVTPKVVYFYGDSLTAVYNFLEDELGVHWIAPGAGNIAYERRATLELAPVTRDWMTRLDAWGIRSNVQPPDQKALRGELASLAFTDSEFKEFKGDVSTWARRMRYNSRGGLWYGHAFTEWWDKYGKTHPEYFALQPDGKRWPGDKRPASEAKICVSNPSTAARILQDWRERGKPGNANICENDMSSNFCGCDSCRALDAPGPESPVFKQHLTDRYLHLANQVAALVADEKPGTKVMTYAYNEMEQPPRREKVAPNVVIGFVPTCFELDKFEAELRGWKKAGMKEWFLRPNLACYLLGGTIPNGTEKHVHELLQIALANGCSRFDFDAFGLNFGVFGFEQYVMSRTMAEPDQPFEHWAEQYYSAFGAAAPEARRYFELYRGIWEQRLRPNLGKIVEAGKVFNFTRGLYWNLGDYYQLADFDRAEAILAEGAKKDLSPEERLRLRQLQLVNAHAKLVFLAVTTKAPDKFAHSKELLAFRKQHGKEMAIHWPSTIWSENYWGDITGIVTAGNFEPYELPWLEAPLFWRFKLDPENVGLREKYFALSMPEMERDGWELMPTNSCWETPPTHYQSPSAALRKQLKDYDGIGWYATEMQVPADWKGREVYLYFGAVDEACQVYVNGKLAHERAMAKPDDWTTPFAVDITPHVDWTRPKQQFTVRVEDKSGAGGLWRRVWLLSSKRTAP